MSAAFAQLGPRPGVVLCLTVTAALLAGASATSGAQAPGRFQSGVDLVALEVCVRDRDGRFLDGLGPDDFLVL